MGAMVSIAKRTLNVAFIACVLWTVLILIVAVLGLLSCDIKWQNWLVEGALPGICGYALLAVISYIFLGRAIFWHRQFNTPHV
jgi:hypothetical protein